MSRKENVEVGGEEGGEAFLPPFPLTRRRKPLPATLPEHFQPQQVSVCGPWGAREMLLLLGAHSPPWEVGFRWNFIPGFQSALGSSGVQVITEAP